MCSGLPPCVYSPQLGTTQLHKIRLGWDLTWSLVFLDPRLSIYLKMFKETQNTTPWTASMLKYTKLNLPQHCMLTRSNHGCGMFSLSEFECLMVHSSWGHGRDYTVTVDPLYLGTAATQLLCWDYQQADLAASFFRMYNEQKDGACGGVKVGGTINQTRVPLQWFCQKDLGKTLLVWPAWLELLNLNYLLGLVCLKQVWKLYFWPPR